MASDQAILIVVCEDENVKVKIRLSKKKKKGNIITRRITAEVAVHSNVPRTLGTET